MSNRFIFLCCTAIIAFAEKGKAAELFGLVPVDRVSEDGAVTL